MEIALPGSLQIETRSAIESLEAGFLPAPGLRPADKSATFVSAVDQQLRVDFLTPMARGREAVFRHEGLGVNLQPLRFLEFILEDVGQAAALSALGAVMVNVPDPARYALHKMLVFAERRAREPQKAMKDLRQAAALIEVLSAFRRDDLLALWREMLARGPGWRDRARKSLAALRELAPSLAALDPMAEALAGRRVRELAAGGGKRGGNRRGGRY